MLATMNEVCSRSMVGVGMLAGQASSLPTPTFMRPLLSLAALLFVAVPAEPLLAQQFFNVGQEVDGKINVQVNATLNDGIGDYEPMPSLVLTLYRSATDSLQLRTDEAGVLRFAIIPGTYRLASAEAVQWHGRRYRWNIPLVVKRGMGIANLTADNAAVSGGRSAAPSVATTERPAVRRPPVEPDDDLEQPAEYSHKDGSTGVLFGLLVPGGGQFYSGRLGKGFGLLGISIGTYALAIGSCASKVDSYYSNCDSEAVIGLVGYLTPWIYGMVTAPSDARTYNRRHSRRIAMEPVLDLYRGRTGIGLAMRY